MSKKLGKIPHQTLNKAYYMALGVSLSLGAGMLNQGCLTTGQCATCGACASTLPGTPVPVLAVPVLVGGIVSLVGVVQNTRSVKGRSAADAAQTVSPVTDESEAEQAE